MPVVLDELKNYLPKCSESERAELKNSLQEAGQRDEIILGTWRHNDEAVFLKDYFVVDGHTRLEILEELEMQPKFSTPFMFKDMNEVKLWMIKNQMARRNLHPYARAELVMALEKLIPRNINNQYTKSASEKYFSEADRPSRKIAEIAEMSQPTYAKVKHIAQHALEQTKQDLRQGKLSINEAYGELKRREIHLKNEKLKAIPLKFPSGKFQTIVIDPPWPTEMIEKEVRPNQVAFDYPTMSEEELMEFPLPDMAFDNCHLYLWVVHRFMPLGLKLMEKWGFRYQCQLTWVKNVGFSPFSWMYSTEHVLFGRKGSLPLLKMGKRLDFNAKVREHSRKPDEFYELIREVSPGPRIDVFGRESREGFSIFGNEDKKF